MAVPGSFLIGYKSGSGSQRATQVLADVDFLSGGRTVEGLLSGVHFNRLPLTLHS